MEGVTLRAALADWQLLSDIGKRPRTVDYHAEVVEFILARWPADPNALVEGVTVSQLMQFMAKIADLSASRFNAIVSALKATVPAAVRLKRRPVRVKDRPLLTKEQFDRLLQELDGRPLSHGGIIVRFLAHTGLRINEARQIRWCDVLDNHFLLPGSMSKNGRPRRIPFVPGIERPLQALWRVGDKVRVLPQSEVKRSLATACKRAGVPLLTHHDLRHLFATRCIQSGVDLPTVAGWLGHRDGGALLARIYYHLQEDHSLAMADRVQI